MVQRRVRLSQSPGFRRNRLDYRGAQLYEATLDEIDIIERTLIDVSVAHLLPHNAVYAPRLTGDFDLVSESDWFTSERGRVIGEGADQSPLRYRFQRFERKA